MPAPFLKRRLRTEELKAERADKERRAAGLLQLAQELKGKREAQEKAAAERKATGRSRRTRNGSGRSWANGAPPRRS